MNALSVVTSWLATVACLGRGRRVHRDLGPRPTQRLVLYEFEGCPWCRRVREALTQLDLEAEIRPCPKGGHRYRDELKARGGKAQFPYLVDPGQGVEMYESADIARHLYRHYGGRGVPWYFATLVFLSSSQLASIVRAARGTFVRASRQPEEALELYGFDANPGSRLAREALCELELPYVLHNVGGGSPSLPAFHERGDGATLPWLHDPNTGKSVSGSAEVVAYLERTYAA